MVTWTKIIGPTIIVMKVCHMTKKKNKEKKLYQQQNSSYIRPSELLAQLFKMLQPVNVQNPIFSKQNTAKLVDRMNEQKCWNKIQNKTT